jgi:hypothetical protein
MSTLAGQKVKDKYGNLLHVEGGLTGTLKTVEDGSGSTSPLKLSTSAVEVSALSFDTDPTTDNAELTALLLDSNSNVVKRELSNNAFSSVDITFSNPMFVLRPNGAYTLTTTATTPTQAGINNGSNASSHLVNDASNTHLQASSTTTGAVTIERAGLIKIEVSFMLEITATNTDVKIDIKEKPSGGSASTIQNITRTKAAAGNMAIGFSLIRHADADTDIYYEIYMNSGGGGSLLTTSTLSITKLD